MTSLCFTCYLFHLCTTFLYNFLIFSVLYTDDMQAASTFAFCFSSLLYLYGRLEPNVYKDYCPVHKSRLMCSYWSSGVTVIKLSNYRNEEPERDQVLHNVMNRQINL